MHIAFVTGNYPTPSRPEMGTFVQQFVWAMARQGHACSVVNPTSVFERRYGPLPRGEAMEDAGNGAMVPIHRPWYISFSSRNLGIIHSGRWSTRAFALSAGRVIRAAAMPPALVYGHFLYSAGYCAVRIGRVSNCPSVIGVGESSPWTLDAFGLTRARQYFASHGHFLANSNSNKEMLVNLLGITPARILVEPNGVDLSRMFPHDRAEMKNKYGIGTNGFLVAFVGANEVRKGPERVVEAIEGLPGVHCILVGRGTGCIRSAHIVRSGPVSHDVVPELLSCADLFVLPTTGEGSCNAVIEAMACGLPIVTSDGRYMDDIVDDEVAIRVDPKNVREIREAILSLKNDPERLKRMSEVCRNKARQFDVNERARRVTQWMEELVREHRS